MFPQRVLVVNRAKSTTFPLYSKTKLLIYQLMHQNGHFDVYVHKISRFRARKKKYTFLTKNPTLFEEIHYFRSMKK